MDIGEFLRTVNVMDVIVVLFLFGMFILGYVQGSIRRVIGILAMTFSFFLAALLHVPLGEFLAQNWTQYPRNYSFMIAFLTIFVAAVVAFALITQPTYSKVELFAKHPPLDEVLGGLLGVTQGFLLLMYLTIALDTFYYPSAGTFPGELGLLRTVWVAFSDSAFGTQLHLVVIPTFLGFLTWLVPASVTGKYVP